MLELLAQHLQLALAGESGAARYQSGAYAVARTWPTGFSIRDERP